MTEWEQFTASGAKCWFCWLGWQKYENGHIEPNNLGWVECDNEPSVKPFTSAPTSV